MKKSWAYLISTGFVLTASTYFVLATKQFVLAAPDPDLTGTSTLAGLKNQALPVDLQIVGTGNPTVPVRLRATSGSLSFSTTTGLSFTGPSSGADITLSGSLTNVNTALATLTYTRNASGTDTIEASLVEAGEVFFPSNGNLYEYVSSTLTWGNAKTAAEGLSKYGVSGYLTTITSQEENDFVAERLDNAGWMGASDSVSEGVWRWVTGPENGTQFWQGAAAGSAFGGNYENWNSGEPNDSSANEDCGQFLAGSTGLWNDLPCAGTTLPGYVAEYGTPGNTPEVANFDIAVTTYSAPNNPFSFTPSYNVDGSWSSDTDTHLNFSITDPDGGEQVRYRLQIDDTSDFSSPVVDYESALAAQGARSLIVGQAAGSGLYNSGAEGQALSDGTYYWRVRTIDAQGYESSYVVANSGSVALGVDTTSPTMPTLSISTPTNDTTPLATWTASSDSGSGLNSVQPYVLNWSTSPLFSGTVYSSDVIGLSVSTFNTLTEGTWYFRLLSYDAVSNSSGYSTATLVVDLTAPIIDAVEPEDNDTVISRNAVLMLTLDESVDIGSGNINIKKSSDDTDVEIIDVTSGKVSGGGTANITINPDTTLAYDTEYYVQIDSGALVDLAGNDFAGISDTSSWSFTTIADPDPDNDGIESTVEDNGPNGGDGNNDGIKDSLQANVTTMTNSIDGNYVTLAVPSTCDVTSLSTVAESSTGHTDGSYSYPHGLLDFTLDCGVNGVSVTIEQYFYGITENNLVPRKFNPISATYADIDALISKVNIDGEVAYKVVYQITDGGELDTDGVVNGVIRDPIGLALAESSLSSTGTGILSSLFVGSVIVILVAFSKETFSLKRQNRS